MPPIMILRRIPVRRLLFTTINRTFCLFQKNNLWNPLCQVSTQKNRLLSSSSIPPTNVLTDVQYNQISNEVLEKLTEYLERLEDFVTFSGYDCECSSGVLTLRLGNHGTYVINRQPPNKQIWLSSPISGPKRYDFNTKSKEWVYERENLTLSELLNKELSQIMKVSIKVPI